MIFVLVCKMQGANIEQRYHTFIKLTKIMLGDLLSVLIRSLQQ
jgi:hypothetical protein